MSRVINPDSAGKERQRLIKAIVVAVRELAQRANPDREARDLAAFIAAALIVVHGTIDLSVKAWEKRGYWVKADRFRMEWDWAGILGEKLRKSVLSEDWSGVASIGAQVAQKLGDVNVPVRNRIGRPWVGAWDRLRQQK